jgi:beta-lysine 5,6-aminomutase alpha subunit
MESRLGIDLRPAEQARELAHAIVAPVQAYIEAHTTVSVERATLRLMGADGVNGDDVPVPNLAVNSLGQHLDYGAARYYINAFLVKGFSVDALNRAIADGLDISALPLVDFAQIEEKGRELVGQVGARIQRHVAHRREAIARYKARENSPLLYVIVATGNIYEDVKQAQAAAMQGADAIAVIRSTAQSLLDYVPYGATTEGFGGTYATQENFRIMRAALDGVGERIEKYVRLVNYASGLCMPEIAVMGALERLDMMLNDSMYGILFRNINMARTFVDQSFSRMIHAYADIVINTGEDNYLTTADAYEKGYTVLASQFINERFALNAGVPHRLMGLGHAFEMDPGLENGFLYELAQAQLIREIFPDCPLKYMPPTKYMSGDIFKGYAMNTLFNLVGRATDQSILLLGMLTEAIHTPFLQDRYLALADARYVLNNVRDLGAEIAFKPGGRVARRAEEVLSQALTFLEQVAEIGLFNAIEQGLFADVKRSKGGGRGMEGVHPKSPEYWNPFEGFLRKELNVG